MESSSKVFQIHEGCLFLWATFINFCIYHFLNYNLCHATLQVSPMLWLLFFVGDSSSTFSSKGMLRKPYVLKLNDKQECCEYLYTRQMQTETKHGYHANMVYRLNIKEWSFKRKSCGNMLYLYSIKGKYDSMLDSWSWWWFSSIKIVYSL